MKPSKSDPYLVAVGQVIIEMKLRQPLSDMSKFYFENVLRSPSALEAHAKDYINKVEKNHDNIIIMEQFQMVKMMAESRMNVKNAP